jgi:predicted acylesterase/phospholipase RssA/CRP-like cAMP-binding protein
MASAAFLRQVPVLADLSEKLLEQLAAKATEVRIRAGEWLLREGEEAESLYVVRSGRLEVIAEGPPETLIRVMRRGEVLGELALLQRGRRSASVRACRDSVLLEVGREQFESLIQEAPSFAVGLTRAIGARLAASRTPVFAATPPRTIAVIALEPAASASETGELLAACLGEHGSVAELQPDPGRSEPETLEALDRAEREHDRVVLVGGATSPGNPWTDLCVREADLVVAVSTGSADRRWLAHPEALRGCELLVTGAVVDERVIDAFQPREVQVVADPADLEKRIALTARRLAGRSLGVVLSGGGARAFAHLGVLEELQVAGATIDRIGAVSMGAIVGAAFACGFDTDAIFDTFHTGFVDSNPSGDYTLPLFSLVRGGRTRARLQQYFSDRRIEALPTRFFCLSCDLIRRESVVHRTGSVYDAVRASVCIPGVFPPIATPDGRLLVDGGVLDNLPVATMARAGEGPVIAVDVGGHMGGFSRPVRPGVARLARPLRRYLTGSEAEIPRLGETIVRTVTVGSIDTAAAARLHAELVIQPELDGIGLMDWRQLDRARKAGREAARAALEAAPEELIA